MVAILKAVFLDPANIKLWLFPVITGLVVSVVGASLIGKRETAANRQAWINSLREEMVSLGVYLTSASKKDWEQIAKVRWRINLLLNPGEKLTKDLLKTLRDIEEANFNNQCVVYDLAVESYECICSKILKKEWSRVKRERNPIYESKTLKWLRGLFC